jgi:hypothetical protein
MSRLQYRMERLRTEARTALRAFKVAMEQADTERLWLLHGGLEKDTLRIVRGAWGGRRKDSDRSERAAACPLTTLFVGVPGGDEDLRRAERLSERCLRARGLSAGAFYRAWDAGWISTQTLLRFVDAEITRRTLAERSPRPRPTS